MGYELYVLPVPHGGDVEESGEALLALMRDGLLRPDPSTTSGQRTAALADSLLLSGAGLDEAQPQDGVRLLAAAWGLEIAVTTRFVRFRVPFSREGESARATTDGLDRILYSDERDRAIIDALRTVADRHGRPMAQIALSWVRTRPAVTAPIVGTTKIEQLDDAIASLDIALTDDDIAELQAPYVPRPPTELGRPSLR